jgi:hypothetical protein
MGIAGAAAGDMFGVVAGMARILARAGGKSKLSVEVGIFCPIGFVWFIISPSQL